MAWLAMAENHSAAITPISMPSATSSQPLLCRAASACADYQQRRRPLQQENPDQELDKCRKTESNHHHASSVLTVSILPQRADHTSPSKKLERRPRRDRSSDGSCTTAGYRRNSRHDQVHALGKLMYIKGLTTTNQCSPCPAARLQTVPRCYRLRRHAAAAGTDAECRTVRPVPVATITDRPGLGGGTDCHASQPDAGIRALAQLAAVRPDPPRCQQKLQHP